MMKIAYLGAASSIHNQRWVKGLADRGVGILLLSQHEPMSGDWGPNVEFERLRIPGRPGYFLNSGQTRRAYQKFGADLLHAHYATGYGVCATLSRVHPRIVSVWGADVYDAPIQSAALGYMVRRVLRSADAVSSTSHVMAEQTARVGGIAKPEVIPFGIDVDYFTSPQRTIRSEIVIGTVKTLESKYGIDTLIDGFAQLLSREDLISAGLAGRLRLRLVGGGSLREQLGRQADDLGLSQVVSFVGPVAHDQVRDELNLLDIYVAVSRLDSESFGVAILEASACGVPVVVSDAGGLPEVVRDGVTGWVVPRERPDLLADKLADLVLDAERRANFGAAGRAHVEAIYRWETCLDQMQALYKKVMQAAA